MAENTASIYKKDLPPHIHSGDSLARRFWGLAAATTPVFLAACFTGQARILRVFLISLVSAVAFELLFAKFFKKKDALPAGESVLAAALFTLLMPSRCPAEVVVLGMLMTVAAKEFFGGTGCALFHPVLLARVFLVISYPGIMAEPMILDGNGGFWTLAAVGLGGVLVLRQGMVYLETPVLFVAGCFICGALFEGPTDMAAFFSGVLLIAFFFLSGPVGMPLARRGKAFFAFAAAILSSRLEPAGFSIRSAAYAIVLMNLLAPWLDLWLKPVPYRRGGPSKEAASI